MRFSPWRPIPMASDSSPPAASRRFAGGAMTARSRRRGATAIRGRCTSLLSAATAGGSSPRAATRQFACGTERPARRSSNCRPSNGNTPRPSRTTASSRPAAAGTAWSASGIRPRAGCPPRWSSRRASRRVPERKRLSAIDWLAITPGGQVAGSDPMIEMLAWRAGEVSLPAAVARAGLRSSRDRGESDAR